jgi:hypothetical protein
MKGGQIADYDLAGEGWNHASVWPLQFQDSKLNH